jgi:hypothetical protein
MEGSNDSRETTFIAVQQFDRNIVTGNISIDFILFKFFYKNKKYF